MGDSSDSRSAAGRLALVYRGPATLPGCPDAVVEVLLGGGWGLDVRSVGPDGEFDLADLGPGGALGQAVLYAQPGGGTLEEAWRHLRRHRKRLRRWVAGGGRYLGFCLGGYLAGATPGFALLPGDTDQYVATDGADVPTEDDTVVTVSWRGVDRRLFFQDGPVFRLDPGTVPGAADVVARYPNGEVAALVVPYGAGRVGVVGPHPEATAGWFTDVGLPVPHDGPGDVVALDLAHDLIDRMLVR